MASWPSTLPKPLYDGYSISPMDTVIRTDMEAGNKRSRRRSLAQIDYVTANVSLTNEEYSIFRDWFYSTSGADGGNAWFQISLLTGRDTTYIETVESKFSASYSVSNVSYGRLNVTLSLEVRYA